MRADRLLSLLLILQNKGKRTAEELAMELEVSVRTIYRDIDALSISGIPVYADGGPGGGYSLLESYKTDLTALSNKELEALFLLSIPGPLADLAISKKLKSAMLKLSSSMPDNLSKSEKMYHERIHLDSVPWFQKHEIVDFLTELQDAIWNNLIIKFTYLKGRTETERVTEPYGLASKSGIWYLVCNTDKGERVFRVSRIKSLTLTDEPFIRNDLFSLSNFWEEWCHSFQRKLNVYKVKLLYTKQAQDQLSLFSTGIKAEFDKVKAEIDGSKIINMTYANINEAVPQILELGPLVKVIQPAELVERIKSDIHKISKLYK